MKPEECVYSKYTWNQGECVYSRYILITKENMYTPVIHILIPISLQPNVIIPRNFKLWILLVRNIRFQRYWDEKIRGLWQRLYFFFTPQNKINKIFFYILILWAGEYKYIFIVAILSQNFYNNMSYLSIYISEMIK